MFKNWQSVDILYLMCLSWLELKLRMRQPIFFFIVSSEIVCWCVHQCVKGDENDVLECAPLFSLFVVRYISFLHTLHRWIHACNDDWTFKVTLTKSEYCTHHWCFIIYFGFTVARFVCLSVCSLRIGDGIVVPRSNNQMTRRKSKS